MAHRIARFTTLATTCAEALAMGVCVAAVGWGMHLIPRGAPVTTRPPMSAAGPMGSMVMARPVPARKAAMPTISVASLTGPGAAARVRTFTLTARPARLRLGPGVVVDAWTYNGTSPGPTLRVRQGDLVVVHLVNRLPVPTTIHWHGVTVPGGEDGVAGITQDAVAPGHTYTYRFVVRDAGTYWYHAHQDSLTQVPRGLYGALVVTPAAPVPPQSMRDDVDATVVLHTWQIRGKDTLAANGTTGLLRIPARPGAWVRLRLINTDVDMRLVTLVGAPFTVAALDGHDLHGSQPLAATLLPIAAGGRYDLRFRLPARGAAGLLLAGDRRDGLLRVMPAVAIIGTGYFLPAHAAPTHAHGLFDFTAYGAPARGAVTLRTHADASYTLRLGNLSQHFFSAVAHLDPVYTINGKAAPDTAPIMVRRGQLVRLHIVNESGYVHPMHLHGHTLVVLARDGRPLRGSPVTLDTLDVLPGESYDVAFRADNLGIWMLHCHNLYHARYGMSMMIMYEGVTTPFRAGGRAGNVSD